MKKIISMCAIIALTLTGIFTSCKPNDNGETADKAALSALITECNAILSSATDADYPQSAIETFSAVITTAEAILAKADATQAQVDNMVQNLNSAKDVFLASAYGAIPAGALLVGLSFDEGTSTTTSLTAAGKNYIATLNSGIKNSAEYPDFVAGKVGKAVHFGAGGSNLSIDNFTPSDFLGPKLSIAVWVKPDITKADNYFLSWNSWHTWKLQIQAGAMPFMTVATASGISDADNEAQNSCPQGEWHHVVVVTDLTEHTLSFYIDGYLTKTWTAAEKPGLAGTSIVPPSGDCAITIGGAYKNLLDVQTFDNAGETAEAYLSFFEGAIDELKIYNIALTQGQVSKLYNTESAK